MEQSQRSQLVNKINDWGNSQFTEFLYQFRSHVSPQRKMITNYSLIRGMSEYWGLYDESVFGRFVDQSSEAMRNSQNAYFFLDIERTRDKAIIEEVKEKVKKGFFVQLPSPEGSLLVEINRKE
jgi:uncharacterized protein YcgL (UPF0745 family)